VTGDLLRGELYWALVRGGSPVEQAGAAARGAAECRWHRGMVLRGAEVVPLVGVVVATDLSRALVAARPAGGKVDFIQWDPEVVRWTSTS